MPGDAPVWNTTNGFRVRNSNREYQLLFVVDACCHGELGRAKYNFAPSGQIPAPDGIPADFITLDICASDAVVGSLVIMLEVQSTPDEWVQAALTHAWPVRVRIQLPDTAWVWQTESGSPEFPEV